MPRNPSDFLSQWTLSEDAKQERDQIQLARSAAIRWIGLGRKPSGQVRAYLQEQGFSDEITAIVLAELTDEKKLDDLRLALQKSRTRSGAKSESNLRIRQRLSAQGLDSDAIEQALDVCPPDRELALAALQGKFKNHPGHATGLAEQKNKYYRFLISRGFSSEIVREAIREFLKGLADPDDFAD